MDVKKSTPERTYSGVNNWREHDFVNCSGANVRKKLHKIYL